MIHSAPTAVCLSTQNPWPGLRAFTESDRDFFFGRERETAQLLAVVKRSSVVVLYGQSGLGKTSLLQAGLFPELKRLDFLPVRLRFDHGQEAPPLGRQIKLALIAALDRAEVKAPRPGSGETLWEYFHRRDVDFWGARNRLLTPLIVLDQFEEVFTLGQRNESTAARVAQFASELESLIEHRAPDLVREHLERQSDEAQNYDFQRQSVKFLLSLREDFLPQLDPWRARMPSLLPNRFRLERMTGAQALTVVESAGRELVEPKVAQDIVDFVSTSQRQSVSLSVGQRDVEPALLSVVCDELNRRRIERGQARIAADLLTVEREGIIQNFYERAFGGLDESVREWVEDELLTTSGYRDRAAMEDALKQGLPESAFDLLVDRRILHREERQGVVWLELTHDLLSDPAARSRTAREAKASAKREAEFARQLKRTRQWAAIFAVLLAAMVSAFVYMFVLQRRADRAIETAHHEDEIANNAIETAHREEGKANRATQTADNMTRAANQANAEAESNFQRLIDSRTEIIQEYARGDMRIPTAMVRRVIEDAGKDFETLTKLKASSPSTPDIDLELRQARFLTESGDALRQIGEFGQGGQKAQEGLRNLDSLGDRTRTETAKDVLRIARAHALYVRGECRLAVGDLTEARQDFAQSSRLASELQPSLLQQESERILILSTIGSGDVEVRAIDYGSASGHFERALNLIKNLPVNPESDLWKAMALAGIGLSQTEDTEGEHWLAEATTALGGDKAAQDTNLRRKRLFAELAYQRGFIAYRLDKTGEASRLFEQANAASEDLCKRDPENLDWRLSQLQSWRGLGVIYLHHGEWNRAKDSLEGTEKGVKKLNDAQPSWVQARFLRGSVLLSLGSLIQSRDQEDLDGPLKKYAEASQFLKERVPIAPKNLALLAQAFSSQGRIHYAHGTSESTPSARSEELNKALDLYEQARRALGPIQAMQRGSLAYYDGLSGNALLALEKPAEAIRFYDEAVKIRLDVVKKSAQPDSYYLLASDLQSLGDAYVRKKESANAVSEYALASENIDRALAARPRDINFLRQKAHIHAAMFDTINDQGNLPRALEEMDLALTAARSALQDDYSNKALNDDLDRYRRVADQVVKQLETAAKPAKAPVTPVAESKALTPQQSEAMLGKIRDLLDRSDPTKLLEHNQQRAWIQPPLIPGAWRTLGSAELEAARSLLLAATLSLKSNQVLGIRKLPVDFYDNAALYEAEVQQENGELGIVSYLQRGERAVVLNGWRKRITDINRETPPRLDTIERATDYLRFWLGAVQYENGRFALVDQMQDLQWLPSVSAEIRQQAALKIKPLVVQPSHEAGWQAIGTIQVSRQLLYAAFRLSRAGSVEIANPSFAIKEDLPITVEGFLGEVRGTYKEEMGIERLEAQPNSDDALQQLPDRYARVRRWKDAAQAQQRLLDSIRASGHEAEGQGKLASAYTTLSRYQLRAGDFVGALASADAGKKLDESSIALDAYRADALFFLGRTGEGEALYSKLAATPRARAVLEDRVDLCGELKRWKEAVEAQQKLLAFIKLQDKSDAERRKNLPAAYLRLSWYQLMARDFAGALASSEAGRTADPSDLTLETNHAHALLFLGRIGEAETLYLKYRGQKVEGLDKNWEQVIFDDFNDLQKEGLTSPEMAHVRDLLKPGSK